MPAQVETSNQANHGGNRAGFNFAAFVLGLLLPGLGHFSVGERGRAYRIFGGFLVLWMGGLLVGGLGSVRSWEPDYASGGNGAKRNLWFYAQLGAGPIALGFDQLDRILVREAPESKKFVHSIPPYHLQRTTMAPKATAIGHAADFGMLFCALAGLMNVAVALDAARRGPGERRKGQVRIRRGGEATT
ncbi:MAG: hypothetical protein MK085_01870 [Phycisphaerales bacterium]|nr:hypothetical protein [Phycisphaerales bacterium]